MYIFNESLSPTVSIPRNVKKFKKDKIRMECILQTANEVNRNNRKYSKEIINAGLKEIKPLIEEGSLLGELDHPVTREPTRLILVLYKEASHKILDVWWEGNKLYGILETLRTPNGIIMKNLVEDGIPIGFSLRAMGNLRPMWENGRSYKEVIGPFKIITWDSVSYPSHKEAKLVSIKENNMDIDTENTNDGSVAIEEGTLYKLLYYKIKKEGKNYLNEYCEGSIMCEDGICYIPNILYKKLREK